MPRCLTRPTGAKVPLGDTMKRGWAMTESNGLQAARLISAGELSKLSPNTFAGAAGDNLG
jgi:hypothetical protein